MMFNLSIRKALSELLQRLFECHGDIVTLKSSAKQNS
jgi:hypothetical protein